MRDLIKEVVEDFYALAIKDVFIGYHFRKIISEKPQGVHPELGAFAHHIPRIRSFWEIQLLGNSEIPVDRPFDLIGLHRKLQIRLGELGRWVKLFKETLENKKANATKDEIEFLNVWDHKVNLFQERFEKAIFRR